jgi:hypothetical protein
MKMTHTHTDAPWKIEPFAFGRRIVGASGEEVAEIARSLNPNHKANARLIAAAPEMLEACMVALAAIKSEYPLEHGNPTIGSAWGALESAIEKATSNI